MKRRGISELHQHERRALILLRTSEDGADAMFDAFAALRHVATGEGLHIWLAASGWVSPDEVTLIGKIAAAQRQPGDRADALASAIMRCATCLTEAGVLLPHRAVARAMTHAMIQAQDMRRQAPRRLTPLRARAHLVLQRRGFASTSEFVSSGISRQSVSNMCRDGFLERVNPGWYRARQPGASPA